MWQAHEMDLLRRYADEGKSYQDAATALNRARGSIASKARQLGLQFHGRPGNLGAKCSSAKLCERDIPVIRMRLAAGDLVKAVASDYGVTYSAIQDIKHGRNWRHVV